MTTNASLHQNESENRSERLSFSFSSVEGTILFEQHERNPSENLRSKHFRMGRDAADEGLKKIGFYSSSWTKRNEQNQNGSPVWPPSVVGSLAHTYMGRENSSGGESVAIALVARNEEVRGIGVDLESSERVLSPSLVRRTAMPSEAQWISQQRSDSRLLHLVMAKEAVYKLFSPLTGKFFGFKDAELSWSESDAVWTARLLKGLSEEFPAGFECRVFPYSVQSPNKSTYLISAAIFRESSNAFLRKTPEEIKRVTIL